jgi:tRNA (mo5U34)-methyltransferase
MDNQIMELEKLETKLKQVDKSLKTIGSDNSNLDLSLIKEEFYIYYNTGISLREQGQINEALDWYNKAKQLIPDIFSLQKNLTELEDTSRIINQAPKDDTNTSPRAELKFTGTCNSTEFKARCSEHDFWYHSYYFDNGFIQQGDYDIGRDIADYGFPQNMAGMSVLDIGAGSGWFATYFEQLGANVTVTDARGYCDFDVFGRDHYPNVASEKPKPDRLLPDGRSVYYSPVSKGFWIMKDILGLKAEYINARVYEICPELFGGKKFDLVFMGSVLMHLRDPIGALMAAHSVCNHHLICTTYMLSDTSDPSTPLMQMRENAGDGICWWIPNRSCLTQWLKAAGFTNFNIEKTVRLTTDVPFKTAAGKSSGVDQVQQLVHAYV